MTAKRASISVTMIPQLWENRAKHATKGFFHSLGWCTCSFMRISLSKSLSEKGVVDLTSPNDDILWHVDIM